LIGADGAVKASATTEYLLYTPQPLWAEQNPSDWWAATVTSIKQVLQQGGVAAADVAGVGLTGQTEPGPAAPIYADYYPHYRALYPALAPEFAAIAEVVSKHL
jgi:hypothetical protein